MSLQVQNDEKARKFYADVEGHEAVIEYVVMKGDTYNLLHTYVPEELRGRGIAEQLVRGALEQIREQNAHFLPSCPYVQAFLKRHPEYEDRLARG